MLTAAKTSKISNAYDSIKTNSGGHLHRLVGSAPDKNFFMLNFKKILQVFLCTTYF